MLLHRRSKRMGAPKTPCAQRRTAAAENLGPLEISIITIEFKMSYG